MHKQDALLYVQDVCYAVKWSEQIWCISKSFHAHRVTSGPACVHYVADAVDVT